MIVNPTELLREFLAEYPEYIPECMREGNRIMLSSDLLFHFSRWAIDCGKLSAKQAERLGRLLSAERGRQ